MNDTPADPNTTAREPYWAKPSIGIYQLTLFLIAFGVVLWLKNENALLLLIGAVITNAGTIINYYFGSSAGSSAKTALLTGSAPVAPPPATTPPAGA